MALPLRLRLWDCAVRCGLEGVVGLGDGAVMAGILFWGREGRGWLGACGRDSERNGVVVWREGAQATPMV